MIYIGFGSVKEQYWNTIHNRNQETTGAQHRGGRSEENREQQHTLTYIQTSTRGYDPLDGASELDID